MYNKFRTRRKRKTPFDAFRPDPVRIVVSDDGNEWTTIGYYTDVIAAQEIANDLQEKKCYKYVDIRF